jgi:hypothetical protein
MIMGDTVFRSLGQQSASKLLRSIKPGCIIDCVGQPASLDRDDAGTSSPDSEEVAEGQPRAVCETCIEFVAWSVQIVCPRVVSSRSNALPPQLLATLTSPLSRVQRIEDSGVRLSQSSSALGAIAQRKNKQNPAPARPMQKYKCPLSENDIVEVSYGIYVDECCCIVLLEAVRKEMHPSNSALSCL